MLKRFLAFGPAVLVLLYGLWIGPKYDRYVLPAFDGFVYDAMADNPRVFTLAPWGYRILAPWIVHLIRAPSAAEGYFWLTLVCLAGTLLVLHSWLRRLGFTVNAAALAGVAFAVSPPIRLMLDYQVLVDPLALLIVALFLRELWAPRLWVLAALLAAGALTKEACVLQAFILPVILIPKRGFKRGWLETALLLGPALCLAIALRLTWGEARPALEGSLVQLFFERVSISGTYLVSAMALSGIGLLAVVGLVREPSLPLRILGSVTWALTFVTALANPYHFSIPDLSRLSAFAWPSVLPLALAGLGFRRGPEVADGEWRRGLTRLFSAATLVGCALLVSITDSFRHEPEDAWESPIRYLARNREALKTAALLDAGGALTFDSESGRYKGPITQRFNLTEGRLHRWFLFDGFGRDAVFEAGAPEFRGEAQLLVPVMGPRTLKVNMLIDGPKGTRITVSVAGRDVTGVNSGEPSNFLVPASALTRGDNVLMLKAPPDPTLRLKQFEVRAERPH